MEFLSSIRKSIKSRAGIYEDEKIIFRGSRSTYFLHYDSFEDDLSGKYKTPLKITGIERIKGHKSDLYGETGKKYKKIQIFVDKFIDVDVSKIGEEMIHDFLILEGKKSNSIKEVEISLQNEFSSHGISPRIIYYDNSQGKPIILIKKCTSDLFDYLLDEKRCDGDLLNRLLKLYQFPPTLDYIYLDVKPENIVVCRESPEHDYQLQLIDFDTSFVKKLSSLGLDNMDGKFMAYKIMLLSLFINMMKYYDVCKPFCDAFAEYLNSITENDDFEIISQRPELNHVMKHYFKKATNKNYEGAFLKLYRKLDIYLRKLGPGKMTRKKKGKKKKSRKIK